MAHADTSVSSTSRLREASPCTSPTFHRRAFCIFQLAYALIGPLPAFPPLRFVGQVPTDKEESDLLPLFTPFGTVEKLTLVRGPESRSRGCAMVQYRRWSEAELAQEALHGTCPLPGGRGRPRVVHFSNPRRLAGAAPGEPAIAPRKLFVGQIPKTATETDVAAVFEPHGDVVEVNILKSKGAHAGCAFVQLGSWAACEAAIEALHENVVMPGCEHALVVKFADAKKTDSLGHGAGSMGCYGPGSMGCYGPGMDSRLTPGARASALGLLGLRLAGALPPGLAPPYLADPMGGAVGMGALNPLGVAALTPALHLASLGGLLAPPPGSAGMAPMAQHPHLLGLHAVPGPVPVSCMGENGPSRGGNGDHSPSQAISPPSPGSGPSQVHHPPQEGAALDSDASAAVMFFSNLSLGANAHPFAPQAARGLAPPTPPSGMSPPPGMLGPPLHALPSLSPLPLPQLAGSLHSMSGAGLGPYADQAALGALSLVVPSTMRGQPMHPIKLGRGVSDPALYAHKLFVGQIPLEATEQDLWPLFSSVGDILELAILRSQGRSKGCAFLTYASQAQAAAAIATLHGRSMGHSRRLVVKYADAKS